MVTRLTDNIYDLDMGLAFSIDRAKNKTIRCIESHLWLTEAGLAEDIILAPSESYKPKNTGQVVLQALGGKARFTVTKSPGWFARFIKMIRGVSGRRLAARFSE